MSLPDVSRYKPDPKWLVTDQDWECALLTMLRQDVYVRELNSYVVSKVKANVLASIVPPVLLSTRKARGKGRWVQKPGLSMSDSRPNYVRSLSTYGDLFFETALGAHKEFLPQKGRGMGLAGQFIIYWECDMVLERGTHPRCPDIDCQQFFNSLATVYALVEEAKSRGDHVTLLVSPGTNDDVIPMHRKQRRSPKIPLHFVSAPPHEMYPTYPETQEPWTLDIPNIFDYDAQLSWGRWTYPHEHAPEGPLKDGWKQNATSGMESMGTSKKPNSILSGFYYWRDSVEYDEILNELLNMYYPPGAAGLGFAWPMWVIASVDTIMRGVPTADKRGTFIFLTGMQNMDWTWESFHYFRKLHKKYDIYIMDVGEGDWAQTFLREPTFKLRNGQPYINYLNINHLAKISISQYGTATFSDLEINVGGDSSGKEIIIDFNSGDKKKVYSIKGYPMLAQLVEAIQTDFKELRVERITVPRFPTVNIVVGHRELHFADGAIFFNGPDVENFTYKLLKKMGGKVNGVSIV